MLPYPRTRYLALLIVLLLLSSCRTLPTPTAPAAEATLTQEALPSSTTAPTGTLAPLPTPTITTVPTPTETAAPTTLNPAGPYVLFRGETGIWIANPDGSVPTRLSDIESNGDLRRALSPSGDKLAVVAANGDGLDLVLVSIPSGEAETVSPLIRLTPEEAANAVGGKSFALYAIRDYDGIAWQPNIGRYLAFTGAIQGPTSDLYLYDTETKEITQLTDGLSQAVLPTWSPYGMDILHFGVSWVPPFGGAILGANRLDGLWAVHIPDGKVTRLPQPKASTPLYVGWQDPTHFMIYDANDTCYNQNLRSIDITTGKTSPVMSYSFYYEIAQSPENGTLVFSSTEGCASSAGEGVYMLFPGETTPVKLLDKTSFEIRWLPESQVFFVYPEALISADGQIRYDPPVYDKSYHPAVSKNGYQAWQVIENQQGRVVVKVGTEDWQTILNGMVDELIWDPVEGNTLLIAMEDGSLYAASYPDFEPKRMGSMEGRTSQSIWVK